MEVAERVVRLPSLPDKAVLHLEAEQRGVDLRLEISRGKKVRLSVNEEAGTVGVEEIWLRDLDEDDRLHVISVMRGEGEAEANVVLRAAVETGDDAMARAKLTERQERGREALRRAGQALARAQDEWQQTAAAWKSLGDTRREARALERLAHACDLRGDNRRAREFHRAAKKLATEVSDTVNLARIESGLGRVESSLGNIQEAVEAYRRAMEHAGEVGADLLAAKARHNLAVLFIDLAQLGRALDLLEESRAIFQRHHKDSNVATELMGLGDVHAALGDAPLAAEHYRRARKTFAELNLVWNEGMAALALGSLQARALEEESEAGIGTLQQARALAQRAGNARGVVGADLALGWAQLRAGRHAAARLRFAGAAERLKGQGEQVEVPEALLGLAEAARRGGDTAEAERAVEEGLDRARRTGRVSVQARLMSLRAALRAARGHREKALQDADGAIAIAESVRAQLDASRHRTFYSTSLRPLYQRAIEILTQQDVPTEVDIERAFAYSDRLRGRVLVETLEAARGARREPGPKEQAALYELRRAVDRAEAELAELISRGAEEAAAGRAEARVARAVRRYQRARDKLGPEGMPAREGEPSAAEIIARLGGNTTLLEYHLGPERSLLWVLGAQGIDLYRLPGEAQIAAKVRRAYELLTLRNRLAMSASASSRARIQRADAELEKLLRSLSSLLLAPAISHLSAPRLAIVADASLHYLPFGALFHPGSGEPLALGTSVVRTPRAQAPSRTARRPARPGGIAVLADPVYSAADSRLASPRADDRAPFARLPFSRQEAEVIGALAPGAAIALDFDAREAWLKRSSVRSARVLHLATHGIVDSRRAELSSLVLSRVDGRGRPQDGRLRLHEIQELELAAELVVLSGCETALGRVVRGEGMVGLTRAFMTAGADTVIASLWRVRDRQAAELMERFYRNHLEKGMPVPAALQSAQRMTRAQPGHRSPYFWAAFELHGWPAPPR